MARFIQGNTFATVYEKLLRELTKNPEYTDTAPRGMKIKEIRDVVLEISDSTKNLFTNSVRGVDETYLAGELLWYLSARRDLEFIKTYSKFWEKIADASGNLNSAYGFQLWDNANEHGITEWEWAKSSLLHDRDTRQAIMRFNKPEVSYHGNKDFVCTLTGVFQIRNNKLNLSVNMRSSDAILGLTYDIPFFSLLIQIMCNELRTAGTTDVVPGTLTMLLNSSHVYERHFDLVNNMLTSEFRDASLPVYDYDLVKKPANDIVEAKCDLSKWIKSRCR